MELFLNSASLHGQYGDAATFAGSLHQIMKMRHVARQSGTDIHCDARILHRNALPGIGFQKVVGAFPRDRQRAIMFWLTKGGPFWEVERRHGGDDYLVCGGDVVTDSAVAEAAFRVYQGGDASLVSFSPSDWTRSPIRVSWRRVAEGFGDEVVEVENFWTVGGLTERLNRAAAPVLSWDQLQRVSQQRFARLTFGDECFSPLRSLPFRQSAADRVLGLLGILDGLAGEFGADGRRTARGHSILRDHFTGERAAFSDSSRTEKRDFGQRLHFPHPDQPGLILPCTWHGKVSSMTLRLHFSWPIQHGKPVYVMYIGQKLTRR